MARKVPASGQDAKASSARDKASSSSEARGSYGEDESSSSDSSSYFVRDAHPEVVAVELGAKPTAMHLGGNIVKSLRLESRDREHALQTEAGDSFCFPLMEELMESGLKNMLESAQDLSLKAFVAAHRQLVAESSSKSVISDLEAKVAALEQEKAALQQRLDKSATEKATLTAKLLATTERAVQAEDAARAAKKLAEEAETRQTLMRNRLHTFKEAIKTGAAKLQMELPDLLEKYGLVAPDMSSEDTDTVGLEAFVKWLRACVAMLDVGAHFHEDLSAVVAVNTLSAAVYGLFPTEASNTGGVTKAQLRSLRDKGFCWPEEDAVRPEMLPALVKNIAKNFMDHFFKGEGRALVRAKLNEFPRFLCFFALSVAHCFWVLVSFNSKLRLMPSRSPFLPKLWRLWLLKKDLEARIVKLVRLSHRLLAKTVGGLQMKPRCSKTTRRRLLLARWLARCEGRGS